MKNIDYVSLDVYAVATFVNNKLAKTSSSTQETSDPKAPSAAVRVITRTNSPTLTGPSNRELVKNSANMIMGIHRLFPSITDPDRPLGLLGLKKRKYKVMNYLGATPPVLQRKPDILDTGAGSNVLQSDPVLPTLTNLISPVMHNTTFRDANDRHLHLKDMLFH